MSRPARRASFSRRLRSIGGRVIRRLGMLPGGQPDGLGDDDRLEGMTWDARVLVYFADTPDGLYQLQQWYTPLQALDERMGVVVVCADSRTSRAVARGSDLTTITIARDTTLERLVREAGVRVALYVNYNPLNTACLRFTSVVHVSLLHGDSDKTVSVSNQVKAYDFSLVAGQAAIDRYRTHTMLFDAAQRCIVVGRPQLDLAAASRSGAPQPKTVLYAPTWEGASDAVAYGSLISHGERIVTALLAAGMRVRYRPHPLTGVRDGLYGDADARVRAILAAADRTEPGRAAVSTATPLAADFGLSDLLIADISAVPVDWLPTGRPLLITVPQSPTTLEAKTRLLDLVPRLDVKELHRLGDIVAEHLDHDPARGRRAELTEYYLGSTDPDWSLRRFLDVCSDLADIAVREFPDQGAPGSAGH